MHGSSTENNVSFIQSKYIFFTAVFQIVVSIKLSGSLEWGEAREKYKWLEIKFIAILVFFIYLFSAVIYTNIILF